MSEKQSELKFAFQKAFPVMIGYLMLAMGYGLYMHNLGFSFWFPTIMAAVIYGGSVEFIVASLLVARFAPWNVFLVTLVVGFRQFFYSLAMLNKYRNTSIFQRLILIFGESDETFSVNYALEVPTNLKTKLVYTYVTIFNYLAWVMGAFLGGFSGHLLGIQLRGLNFMMTALFIVLFLEQFLKEQSHLSSFSGLIITTISLVVIGKTYFLLVTLSFLVVEYAIKYYLNQKRVFPHDID
ncbi:AzlC family ABC transporter permease [Liquorilactobacillus nagelii]|uniref:AzlC family ABC transporter permease n=1 Tax=Liquorilactobacillus nagelii TaxID=82688 RepID=UPI001CCC2BDB|nr:AzlC family ABC transporter permease [Liquorilactobacillus nagelii]ULQ49194.1 AzlC family ABC transporter permease [Liquorilactobacillus nagelii]